MSDKNPSPIERIKKESHSLRGTIADGLKDEITGAISEDDQAVINFMACTNRTTVISGRSALFRNWSGCTRS